MNKIRTCMAIGTSIIFVWLLGGCMKQTEVPEPGLYEESTGDKNPYEYEVDYQIPEGLYASGSGDDYIIYYNEDETETYTAWVWTCYDTMEQYLLSRYSDCRTMFPDNSEISSAPIEEIIGDYTVNYITVSYTRKYGDALYTYQRIYAGVYLPEGILFELEAETMEDGDFGFEKLRPFFEELTVKKQSDL
ncbi:MAG: hypothetical protein NC089_09105 [Bacteroides sp.]|nr:hypothetical protein [Bacteroides sp.]MCM1549687.1 hypothetical protein [Clostridium sp.]